MKRNRANDSWPLEIKSGSAVVKIYRTQKVSGYVSFSVVFYKGQERKVRFFQDLAEAKVEAKKIADEIVQGNHVALEIGAGDRLAIQRAMEILAPLKLPMDSVCREHVEALRVLGGAATILEACRDFARRNSVALPKITVAAAVELMVQQAGTDGKSEKRRDHLKCVMGRFAGSFNVEVHTLAPTLISDYLAALPFKERTKRNHRDTIGFFNRWLILRGYLQKESDWLEGVQNYTARKIGEITTYTAEDMRMFLANASDSLLPVLLIGGFAGLRHAEIARLDWSDIDLEENFIEVAAHKSKTDVRRIVPIKNNLKAWLQLLAKPTGPVVTLANSPDALVKLGQKIGMKWKHNALRHTYISARVAECADVPRVADEAGNSPQIIRTNYLKRIRPAVAAAWFNIYPNKPVNVVPVSPQREVAA